MTEIEMTTLKQAKKILITGDAGRGKTTFAFAFAGKLGLPCHSVDTYQWKTKFSEQYDRNVVVRQLREIYDTESWIVEGTTKELVEDGIARADVIFYFCFDSLFDQWLSILRRYAKEKEGSFGSLLIFLKHVLYKRYHLGYMKDEETVRDVVVGDARTVIIHSFREWRNILKKL